MLENNMRIYLVRHGQTEYNAKELYMTSDIPLSEVGKKQSETLAKRFEHLPVDAILVSPYKRTRQTASMVEEITGKQAEIEDDLKEIVRPSSFAGRHIKDKHVQEVKQVLDQHKEDPNFHHSDEENFYDLVKRAKRLIKKLEARGEKHILLITHEGFMKVILYTMMYGDKVDPQEFDNLYYFFKVKNTGLTICDREQDGWKLVTWNDHAHLGE